MEWVSAQDSPEAGEYLTAKLWNGKWYKCVCWYQDGEWLIHDPDVDKFAIVHYPHYWLPDTAIPALPEEE